VSPPFTGARAVGSRSGPRVRRVPAGAATTSRHRSATTGAWRCRTADEVNGLFPPEVGSADNAGYFTEGFDAGSTAIGAGVLLVHQLQFAIPAGQGRVQDCPPPLHAIRILILRLVRQSPSWGYRRMHGGLAIPGIKVAASTVQRGWQRLSGIPPPAGDGMPGWCPEGQPPCTALTRSGRSFAAFGVPSPVTGSHPVVAE
jgi:hypothetical protein